MFGYMFQYCSVTIGTFLNNSGTHIIYYLVKFSELFELHSLYNVIAKYVTYDLSERGISIEQ